MISLVLPYLIGAAAAVPIFLLGIAVGYSVGRRYRAAVFTIPACKSLHIEVTDARITRV